jgi:hypothetical protein
MAFVHMLSLSHVFFGQKFYIFLCPVALHNAPNKFMSIYQRALILRAVYSSGLLFARQIKLPAESRLDILYVLIIKLTKETRRRVSRGRD